VRCNSSCLSLNSPHLSQGSGFWLYNVRPGFRANPGTLYSTASASE
jgi:hypothetical protein